LKKEDTPGCPPFAIFADMEQFVWGHARRFNAYSNYFKKRFGERLQKLSVNAGFTCPNRDGTVARGGCTYCNNDAFSPSYCNAENSVAEQIQKGIAFHKKRYGARKFLAYFQNFSNTYASLPELKQIYEQALQFPEVEGLIIGTRPDVIDDAKLAYFKELSQEKYLVIEYGVESCYDKTLQRVNRGHTFAQSREAIQKTTEYGIYAGAHFMLGLPGETKEMMREQVQWINQLPLHTIKFHQLQIMKNTAMAADYQRNPEQFKFFDLAEYVEFIIDIVSKLHPEFIIERFSGEAPPRYTLSPGWGLRTPQVLNLIEKRMAEKNTWQGKFLRK